MNNHLIVTVALAIQAAASPGSDADHPVVDPEVRDAVQTGTVRVLVQLRVPEEPEPTRRAQLIAAAQAEVLSRLGAGHAMLVRRYTSIPVLALEIDATALAELEAMGRLVDRVAPDSKAAPSGAPMSSFRTGRFT